MNQTQQYFIPLNRFLIEDAPQAKQSRVSASEIKTQPEILERYWNDIYKLFINRLSQFDVSPKATDEDKAKLKSLLDELIYVKTILADN